MSSRPLIDRASACDAALAAPLRDADFIFLLGGFPAYLAETLAESICWQYALAALVRGAVLGGSSAGAMILADHYYDPYSNKVKPGLGLLRGCCIIPHFRRFGARWQKLLTKALPEAILIGIDEYTGIIKDFPRGGWTVHGAGRVYLGGGGRQMQRFRAGEGICYDALQVPRI